MIRDDVGEMRGIRVHPGTATNDGADDRGRRHTARELTYPPVDDDPTVKYPRHGLIGVINLANEKPGVLRYADGPDSALRLANEYRDAGFAALDLGAQSSHYSVRRMTAEEQIALLVPVVTALAADGHHCAVETDIPEVVSAVVQAGATCVNLSGQADSDEMLALIAKLGAACITSFTPRDSPSDVDDIDITRDLAGRHVEYLRGTVARMTAAGVHQLIVDAGIGYSYRMPYSEFAKYQVDTVRHTRRMGEELRYPTLVAVPRVPDTWLVAAFAAVAIESGADLLRCHDPEVGMLAKLLGFIPGDVPNY